MNNKILVINPGSTSTKIAVFDGEKELYAQTLRHTADELAPFPTVTDQYAFREKLIVKTLEEQHFSLSDFGAIIGRGGMVRPLASGVYRVNDAMMHDLQHCTYSEAHACNLGGLIAHTMAHTLPHCEALIADPVVVDELQPVARISGLPQLPRIPIFHALNHKAIARRYAVEVGKKYEELNLVVAHMGGGISVGAHKQGLVVDVNQALDGYGPFSPERAGTLPFGGLLKMCFSGKYTHSELKKMLVGKGGLQAHLGTTDVREIEQRIAQGDEKAALVLQALAYNVTKEIGAMLAAMDAPTDAILLTGGIAHCQFVTDYIVRHVERFAPVRIYPGEDEMKALAQCALRVMQGEEAKVY